ncbi:hypothetical protein [Ehrlichia muris]|uniref:Uncharacterized protein n=1 Tax=Ehrlichia muris AS145 TaxID=1423892 RepID=V9R8X1_9RICK|nr:hypothetical protein [Ehrlichia muris]AHC39279.1 hypothetical protein EMUR_02635 [Ehrlichia muris AS145]
MIHNNRPSYAGNVTLNVAAALSTVVALSATIFTVLSGMNLALDLKIPGVPKASASMFLVFFLAFATSTVLLIGISALSKHFTIQEQQNNQNPIPTSHLSVAKNHGTQAQQDKKSEDLPPLTPQSHEDKSLPCK